MRVIKGLANHPLVVKARTMRQQSDERAWRYLSRVLEQAQRNLPQAQRYQAKTWRRRT